MGKDQSNHAGRGEGLPGGQKEICFEAQVYKLQTLADKGIRLVLDLPESATLQLAQLAEASRHGVILHVRAIPEVVDGPIVSLKRRAAKRRDR